MNFFNLLLLGRCVRCPCGFLVESETPYSINFFGTCNKRYHLTGGIIKRKRETTQVCKPSHELTKNLPEMKFRVISEEFVFALHLEGSPGGDKLKVCQENLLHPLKNKSLSENMKAHPCRLTRFASRVSLVLAKHGSEMASYKGYAGPRGGYDGEYKIFRANESGMVHYPSGLGNMCVGEVTEIGADVTEIEVGERVFRHSSFREENVWDASGVRKLPDGVPWQAAVCLDSDGFRARSRARRSCPHWRCCGGLWNGRHRTDGTPTR